MRSPYPDLCASVLMLLKESEKIRPIEISDILGVKPKSVRDELRRLTEESILSEFVTKEKAGNATYYRMDPEARQSSVLFLKNLSRKTWKFGQHYKVRTSK